jgi:hypothetical protein
MISNRHWLSWHIVVAACCFSFVLWSCARYFSEQSFVGVIQECSIVNDPRGGQYDTKSYFAVTGKVSYVSNGSGKKVTYRHPIEPSFQCTAYLGKTVTIFVSELSSESGRLNGHGHDWFTLGLALLIGITSVFLRMEKANV